MVELLLWMILSRSPTCIPINTEFLKWGEPQAGTVESNPVPQGRVWFVRAAGISTNDVLPPQDYFLEVLRPVRSQNYACCWRIPIERSHANATPLLALSQPRVLHEGEKLAARTNGPAKMALEFVYYDLAKSCLRF